MMWLANNGGGGTACWSIIGKGRIGWPIIVEEERYGWSIIREEGDVVLCHS